MRKLSDLKENEFIKAKTAKEIEWIRKNIKQWLYTKIANGLVYKDENDFYLLLNPNQSQVISATPASEFIKPKKYKLKKLTKRVAYLEDLFANMNVKPVNKIDVEASDVTKHPLAGSWRKETYSRSLMFVEDVIVGNASVLGYGFDNNMEFKNPLNIIDKFRLQSASKEEVESALIAEAKRLGFKEGMIIHSPNAYCNSTLKPLSKYEYNPEENALNYMYEDGVWIPVFLNGKWAEIIEQPNDIDWSIPGQLVMYCSGNSTKIILNDGQFNNVCFSGTIVHNNLDNEPVGRYSKSWTKSLFVINNEPITL